MDVRWQTRDLVSIRGEETGIPLNQPVRMEHHVFEQWDSHGKYDHKKSLREALWFVQSAVIAGAATFPVELTPKSGKIYTIRNRDHLRELVNKVGADAENCPEYLRYQSPWQMKGLPDGQHFKQVRPEPVRVI